MKTVKRRILRLKGDRKRISRTDHRKREGVERWYQQVQESGMYPLNSPGMPIPGPNFMRHASEIGDDDSELHQIDVEDSTKKSGKKKVWAVKKVGERLKELYLRALREPA